jgi:hypothetical protein
VRNVRLTTLWKDGAVVADPKQPVRGFATLVDALTLVLTDYYLSVAIIIVGVHALRQCIRMWRARCVVLPDASVVGGTWYSYYGYLSGGRGPFIRGRETWKENDNFRLTFRPTRYAYMYPMTRDR